MVKQNNILFNLKTLKRQIKIKLEFISIYNNNRLKNIYFNLFKSYS